MNKQYRKGYIFEIKVKKHLEDLGILSFRSAGSHSVADIIAIGETIPNVNKLTSDKIVIVFLIQCKAGKGVISKQERDKLIATSKQHNCYGVIATSVKGKIRCKIYLDDIWIEFGFPIYSTLCRNDKIPRKL